MWGGGGGGGVGVVRALIRGQRRAREGAGEAKERESDPNATRKG